jgi:hypothetical protein
MERVHGSYDPPREVEEMGVCRLVGPGWIGLSPDAITVGGAIVNRPLPFPARPIAVGVGLGGSALALALGMVDQIMPFVAAISVGLFAFAVFHERETAAPMRPVPWSRVDRILQFPREPERFVVLFEGEPGLPETIYFTPSEGPEAFLAAVRAAAPASVHVDTEAALQAEQDRAAEPEEPEEES